MMNRLGTVGIIRNMVNKPTRRIDMLDYQNDITYVHLQFMSLPCNVNEETINE